MIAFKGFTGELTATYGKGIFQYEPGKTYTEEKSKTRSTGFHCAEYILDCMKWYQMDGKNRFFVVDAAGYAMLYMVKHPKRDWQMGDSFVQVKINTAEAPERGMIAIARGTDPKVRGAAGSVLGLIKENAAGDIIQAKVFTAGSDVKVDTWYTVTEERELRER